MRTPKFEIFKSRINEEYYFRLKAVNGEIILSSEGYKSKQSCEKGVQSVSNHASSDENFERKMNKNGDYYFILKARNNKVIGISEMYTSKAGMNKGIQSVKNNAKAKKHLI